jgi:membrane dipeptidase
MEASNQNNPGGAKKWIGLIIPILGIALYLFQGHLWETSIDPQNFKARAENVMKTTPLIDGHNDLPYLLRLELKNKIYDSKFDFKQGWILFFSNPKTQLLTILQGLASHTDLARLEEGRVGGQFWSVFVEVRYYSPNLSRRHQRV